MPDSPSKIMVDVPAAQRPPHLLDEALRDIFHYDAPFRAMICRPCQCVVFDAQVNRHLRLHHKGPGLAGRQFLPREVLSYFQRFPQRVRSADELAIPSEPVPVVPFLSICQDTFQCGESSCRWIGRGIHRIQEHYRLQHGRRAPPASERSTTVPPWAPILSQQFIARGPGSQRFAVLPFSSDERDTHNLPARSPTPRSSPPVASRASVVDPAPPAALHDLQAPSPNTLISSSDQAPRAQASDPAVQPPTHLLGSQERVVRSLSSTPGTPTAEGGWPRGRSSTTPRRTRQRTSTDAFARPPPPPTSRPESSEGLLLRALADRARDCPLCRAEGLFPSARTHPLESCPGANAELIRHESEQLLQRVDIRSQSCWGCGLPQSFCDQFQDRSHDAKVLSRDRTCYAPRIMAPTIICIGIFDTGRFNIILGSIEGGEQVDLEDSDQAYHWFAEEKPFLSMVATRLTQVFYRLSGTAGLPVVVS